MPSVTVDISVMLSCASIQLLCTIELTVPRRFCSIFEHKFSLRRRIHGQINHQHRLGIHKSVQSDYEPEPGFMSRIVNM